MFELLEVDVYRMDILGSNCCRPPDLVCFFHILDT